MLVSQNPTFGESQGVTPSKVNGGGLFDNGIEKLPKYLTSFELAKVLNVSEHTIRAWRKFKIITPKKFGRSVRWLLEEVLEELSKRRSYEKS